MDTTIFDMQASTTSATPDKLPATLSVGFVGGGNMAQAIISSLLHQGLACAQIHVLEPFAASRERLYNHCGVSAYSNTAQALQALAHCNVVLWAVKPQVFVEAAKPVVSHTRQALHVSVMAGVPSAVLTQQLQSQRVVRTMPNTPALIGQGMAGLFACAAVSGDDKALTDTLLQGTGKRLWFDNEAALNAVTALSGSGPAYVFYFLEAMQNAGVQLGLDAETSKALALQTFLGATALAANSQQTLSVLREQVTSKGGTTHAALSVLQEQHVQTHFIQAMQAAHDRAVALGAAFATD